MMRKDYQKKTPYYRALKRYGDSSTRRFHLPGHNGGRWASSELLELVGEFALASDTSQVLDLDDIHYPEDCLSKAQKLASDLYGVDRTWFGINGSTAMVQAMILASVFPGDKIIVSRSAHRSVWNSLVMSGAVPLYARPSSDVDEGIPLGLRVGEVQRLFDANSEVKALCWDSVSLYGTVCDNAKLVDIAKSRGAVALVDEAWGAHLIASSMLPVSACECGADLIAHSSHKLLNALSQGAMLHQTGTNIPPERVEFWLRALQTSSPSSLLTASIDLARRDLALYGDLEWERVIDLAKRARSDIESQTSFRCTNFDGEGGSDPTRLVISASGLRCDGEMLECRLRYLHSIQIDYSERDRAVLSLTPAHNDEDIRLLVEALKEVERAGRDLPLRQSLPPFPAWNESVLTPREAFYSPWELVPLDSAVGRISAIRVISYPPGVTLIAPGELIGAEQIAYLRELISIGIPIEGLEVKEDYSVRVNCARNLP